jgi:hypothetical protein
LGAHSVSLSERNPSLMVLSAKRSSSDPVM